MKFRRILTELDVRQTVNIHTVNVLTRSASVKICIVQQIFSIQIETVVTFRSAEVSSTCVEVTKNTALILRATRWLHLVKEIVECFSEAAPEICAVLVKIIRVVLCCTLHVITSVVPHTTCDYFCCAAHYMWLLLLCCTLHVITTAVLHTTCDYYCCAAHYMWLLLLCCTLHVITSVVLNTTCDYFCCATHYMWLLLLCCTLHVITSVVLHTTCDYYCCAAHYMWLLLHSPDSRLNLSLIYTVQSEKDLIEVHMTLERRQPPIAQQSALCHPMFHPDTSKISCPHQPLASMWVVALHYLLCIRTHPYSFTLLSTGSGHFRAKTFSLYVPLHFLNIVILRLSACEDGTECS
jgi:hypothetical protein